MRQACCGFGRPDSRAARTALAAAVNAAHDDRHSHGADGSLRHQTCAQPNPGLLSASKDARQTALLSAQRLPASGSSRLIQEPKSAAAYQLSPRAYSCAYSDTSLVYNSCRSTGRCVSSNASTLCVSGCVPADPFRA